MELKSRTAVITGGASGIGRAVAQRLHRLGVNICILDINEQAGREFAMALGERAAFHATDITDDAQVRAAVVAAADRFGDIHICGNFAGVAILKRTIGHDGAMPLESFRRCVDINLSGTFNVVRLCAERMTKNAVLDEHGARGCIVNVSSVAAFQGPSGTVAYSAAKAAIVGMTLPLARDLAPFGIRVNTIAPGLILTPMTWGHDESKRREAEQRASQSLQHVLYPPRFGTADEVAHLTQCIIENDYINAECIRIDGGKRV
jgi:3-hydroxyacyl-CoA dehydrogenase/3-hydroxy-2-methylbutyryl-CoA dehydrogenase